MKKIFILFCACVFSSLSAFADDSTFFKERKTYSTQLTFSVTPLVLNKLRIEHEGDAKTLTSKNPVTIETGFFGIYQRITPALGVTAGLYWSQLPTNFNYNSARGPYKHGEKLLSIYSIPITIQGEFPLNRIVSFSANAGFRYYFFANDNFSGYRNAFIGHLDSNGNTIYELRYIIMSSPDEIPYSFLVKSGFIFTVGEGANTISAKLTGNYSPKKYYKGSFTSLENGNISNGTLSLGLNYIGIEFGYGLTLLKSK